MKILMVVAEMTMGGAERIVVQLAEASLARGDRVAVAAAPGTLDGELEALGVERHLLPPTSRSPSSSAATVFALARVIRRWRPDVVHVHNVRVTAYTALSRLLAGSPRAPWLTTFHGVARDEYRASVRVLRLPHLVVFVSNDTARALREAGLSGERIRTIPNAVAPADAFGATARDGIDRELGLDGAPVVAAVGRLMPVKAHELFLEAAARVAERHGTARFLLVGDGPRRAELEQHARELGLDGRVRFTGPRRDARALIARADALVVTSHSEGLSLAVLEALAAGVPVISSDVEGAQELLGSGAGTIVPSRDPDDFAHAVMELLEDDGRRRQMGAVGRELVERSYSLDAMIAAYRELYATLAAA